MYIEFETMQREIVIWLDNAEDVLSELDRLKEDSEHSDDDVNKFKVKCTHHLEYPPFRYSQFPFHMLFSSPPQNIFLQPSFYAILVPTIPLAAQIQRGFPIDIVRNANLLTYHLPCVNENVL